MNQAQITNLQFFNHFMQRYESDKRGVWFELLRDYSYITDFETIIILKGTKMQFQYITLEGWKFKIFPATKWGEYITLGRNRLLKLRLGEIKDEAITTQIADKGRAEGPV